MPDFTEIQVLGSCTQPSVTETLITDFTEIQIRGPSTQPSVTETLIGLQGPPGASATATVHVQTTPSAVWTVSHGLTFRPSTTVFSSGGLEVTADVSNPSIGLTIINVSPPMSGYARFT